MKLYLVRHGESLPSDIDPDQPLSSVGKAQTEKVAHYLRDLNLEIDEIAHSVKLRAKQTAQILASSITPNLDLVEREGLKPMDPVEPLINEIQVCQHHLMLVGHLPFMEKLLTQLVLKEERNSPFLFCGSAMVCLEGEKREWVISWAVSPNLLALSKQHA